MQLGPCALRHHHFQQQSKGIEVIKAAFPPGAYERSEGLYWSSQLVLRLCDRPLGMLLVVAALLPHPVDALVAVLLRRVLAL